MIHCKYPVKVTFDMVIKQNKDDKDTKKFDLLGQVFCLNKTTLGLVLSASAQPHVFT